MSSQVLGVPQYHVAQWAALDADISLLNLLLEVWEKHQLKAVADPFGVERHCILKILTVPIVSFSCVEETRHMYLLFFGLLLRNDFNLLLTCQNLFGEISDLRRPVFLVDHIKPSYHLSQPLILLLSTLSNVVKHFLNMLFTDNFEPSQDQFELEVWALLLEFIHNFPDNLELINEWYLLLLLVK